MNNTDIANRFSRLYTSGKGSNMFIDGDTIYSYGYHFPIAKHTDKIYRGQRIVLYNSRGYSNSTSRHQAHVRSALSDCFLLTVNLSNNPKQWAGELNDRIEEARNKKQRARSEHMKNYYQSVIQNTLGQVNALALFENESAPAEDKPDNGLKSIAMVAKLGDIIAPDQKGANDWKARMLKAGLEGRGLIMPDDWNELSEDEKERRLNGAIQMLEN